MGLDGVELVMEVEDHFGITIQESTAEGFRTVGDLVSLIHERLTNAQRTYCASLPAFLKLRATIRESSGNGSLRIRPRDFRCSSFQGCHMWGTFTTYWLFFIGSIGTLERAHMARVADAANRIQVGATEDEVFRVLGKPLSTYERYDGWSILGIGAHPPQWLYGTTINIKKMFITDTFVMASPLPINIRWFSYDDDDLVVNWDSKGRVSKITIPEIPIDHRADKMLNSIYDCHRVYLAITSMIR